MPLDRSKNYLYYNCSPCQIQLIFRWKRFNNFSQNEPRVARSLVHFFLLNCWFVWSMYSVFTKGGDTCAMDCCCLRLKLKQLSLIEAFHFLCGCLLTFSLHYYYCAVAVIFGRTKKFISFKIHMPRCETMRHMCLLFALAFVERIINFRWENERKMNDFCPYQNMRDYDFLLLIIYSILSC